MRLTVILTVMILAIFGSASFAVAQQPSVTRAELVELIGKLPELNDTKLSLQRQGFSGDKLALALDHENRMMRDKVIAGYIADRLLALNNGNLPSGWAPNGLVSPLFSSGYTNLSRGDKAFYWKVQRSLLAAMTTRDCGLIVKGRMNETRLERTISQAEARLSAATLKRYYQVQRNAIRTGVSRSPKTLSPADSARIQEKINQVLRARLDSDATLAPAAGAFDNMNRASAGAACQAGILFYDVALGLSGRDLDHALLYLNE